MTTDLLKESCRCETVTFEGRHRSLAVMVEA